MNPTTRLASMVRITSYEEANEVVMSKHVRQAKDGLPSFQHLKAGTLAHLHDQEHAERRRVETPLFGRPNLLRLETEILDRALERQLRSLVAGRVDVDVVRTDLLPLVRFSLLPVTAALVGLDAPTDEGWWEELSEFVRVLAVSSALQWKEGDIDEELRIVEEATDRFSHDVFEPAWIRRRKLVEECDQGETAREDLPKDLLTVLLLHLPDRDRGIALRETMLFLGASTGNTAFGVATTIFHLAEWFSRHPEDRARREDLGFIQAAAFEAIRLHPIPGMIRAPVVDMDLSTGRHLKAGSEIFIELPVVNRDSRVFGVDADEFRPGRPLPAGVKAYGFGFGAGAHKCIGRPMATSHDDATAETSLDQSVGSLIRIVRRLLELGVELDPERAPVRRTGSLQERYTEFPIVLSDIKSLREKVDA